MKKSEETKCDNRNMTLMKANHKFFEMDSYYPKTLPVKTFEIHEPKTGGKRIV